METLASALKACGVSSADWVAIAEVFLSLWRASPTGDTRPEPNTFADLWYFVMDEAPLAFESIVTNHSPARWMDEAHKLMRAKHPFHPTESAGEAVQRPVGLDPNESDPLVLWAEIARLQAAVKGPEGYASWQDAATAERARRNKAERALAETQRSIESPAEETEMRRLPGMGIL